MLERIVWLGHAGFFFSGPPRIYIDPFEVDEGPEADLILLTHSHYDHCSPADLAKLTGSDTEIVCTRDCLSTLHELPGGRRIVQAGSRMELAGARIEVVPAYTRKSRMHGRENGWVGYVVEVDGVRWYHAGDTDYIPEMRKIRADIACLPVSGGTVMNMVEAAAAANCIDPQVVVPMHYGTIGQDDIDPDLLGNLTRVKVHALERKAAVPSD